MSGFSSGAVGLRHPTWVLFATLGMNLSRLYPCRWTQKIHNLEDELMESSRPRLRSAAADDEVVHLKSSPSPVPVVLLLSRPPSSRHKGGRSPKGCHPTRDPQVLYNGCARKTIVCVKNWTKFKLMPHRKNRPCLVWKLKTRCGALMKSRFP